MKPSKFQSLNEKFRERWRDLVAGGVVAAVAICLVADGIIVSPELSPAPAGNRPELEGPLTSRAAVFQRPIGSIEPQDEEDVPMPKSGEQESDLSHAEEDEPDDHHMEEPAPESETSPGEAQSTPRQATNQEPVPRWSPRVSQLRDEEVRQAVRQRRRELLENGEIRLTVDLTGLAPSQLEHIVEFYMLATPLDSRTFRVPRLPHLADNNSNAQSRLQGPLDRSYWPSRVAREAERLFGRGHRASANFFMRPKAELMILDAVQASNARRGSTVEFRASVAENGQFVFDLTHIKQPDPEDTDLSVIQQERTK